jgi:hypothetical protein
MTLRHQMVAVVCSLSAGVALAEAPPQVLPVLALPAAATVDGDLKEWGKDGWIKIAIKPALEKSDRAKYGLEGESRNYTGSITVMLKAGSAQGRLFLAVRWPDDSPDADYKGWEWTGTKYAEGKKRDDMFAVRFHLDGDYDRSMLAGKNYRADVWLWSAARTNPGGYAEDMVHVISGKPIENAAEYETVDSGTLYIKKNRDAGNPMYKATRPPKAKEAERLASFELLNGASGSIADVTAKGVWKDGYWNLEFARKLDTGNADDAIFKPGKKILGQIAVFNHSSDEHKSISEPLLFDFSPIK